MSRNKVIVNNTILYFLPSVIGALLPMVTLPIFTRILTPQDYGVYALAQVYGFFMTSLANFGLAISYERNFFQYSSPKGAASLLYSVLGFIVMLVMGFGVLTYMMRGAISGWIIGSPSHADILVVTYMACGILSLKSYFLLFYKNSEDAKGYSLYSIVETVLIVVFSLWLVAGFRVGVIGLAWGQLLGGTLSLTVLFLLFVKKMPLAFDWKILSESVRMSFPLVPKFFLKTLEGQFDKYMIGLMSTVGNVGFYSIGQKIANMGFVGMTAVGNVYSPRIYRKMFEGGERGGGDLGRYLTPYLYVSTLFCLVLAVFSEEAVGILTPPEYHLAIDVSMILLMYYGMMFFGKQPQLIFRKKTGLISLLSLSSIALNVLINIPFILRWGAIGAAWGTFLASLISGGISFIVAQHHYKIDWEYKKVARILGLFLFAVILLISVKHLAVGYGVRLLLKLFLLGAFMLMGMKDGIITQVRVNLITAVIKESLSKMLLISR